MADPVGASSRGLSATEFAAILSHQPTLSRRLGRQVKFVEALDDFERNMREDWMRDRLLKDRAEQKDEIDRYTWITSINDTTRKFVQQAVGDWIESGASLDVLTATLEQQYTAARAQMIAQTETTRLYAAGNQMAWESTQVVDQFRWMTANDERVCPVCGPNHNQLFPLNQMSTLIPAHVNCRCWGQPVVNLDLAREVSRQQLYG